ncbi:MAG: NAD-dependent epimerase/dehydratase family protein [Candidatus Zixiibacteriota bacterium]
MKVFVTGATGFIGGHLLRRLAQTDHQISCLVRSTSNTASLERQNITRVIGDVTDRESFQVALRGHDCVINLANVYSFWEPDPSVYRKVNIAGTLNVMEAALEARVSKIVHVSTGGIYGRPKDVPFTEDSEVGPKRFSEYFETKFLSDEMVWKMYRERGLPLVMVYPMAVLGPGDPKATGEYILRLIQRRLPARVFENKVFTFVHVRDVAEIIYRAATKENNIGEKYIAGLFQHSFGDINRMISEISGVPLPRLVMPDFLVMPNAWSLTMIADIIKRPPLWGMAIDQMRVMKCEFRGDGSKAERELGIEYTPVRDALAEAIASYRQ